MRITIFDLDLNMYATITNYLSNGWCDWLSDNGKDTVDVRLSNLTKFSTLGNGIILEYMGRSVLLDRADYNYIQIT